MASSNIDELQIQIDFLATKTKGLDDAVTKLTEISEVINKMKTNNLKHLSNILDRLAVSSKKASKASETLKQIQESVKANGGVISSLTIDSNGNIQADKLGKIKKNADDADKSVKKLNTSTSKLSKLLASVGRVAMYRAIRSVLKAITETISTGISDAYQWSKSMSGVDNNFAKFMDGIKSSTTYLSNSFGALAMTISNALGSSIENIIDGVADLVNNLSALIAALSGQSTYYKAIKTQQEYAKAVTNTAKALAGFDELNNIGKTSSSSDTSAFANAFEKVDLPDWAQWIKDNKAAIGVVAGLATAFALLKNPLTEIIKGFTKKNGLLNDQTGLESLETGLLGALALAFGLAASPVVDLSGAFEKVNEWINTVNDSIDSFVESIPANLDLAWQYVQNWVSDIVGTKVKIFGWETTIGGIFETLGTTIDSLTNISWEDIEEWVTDIGNTEVDFGGWKTSVSGIFNGLMGTIGVLTGNGLSVAFKSIYDFLNNSDYNIGTWVNDVIKKVGTFATNFANSVSKGLSNAWKNISSWCSQVGSGLSSWFNTLGSKISQWWQNLWDGSLLQGIVSGVRGLVNSWNSTTLGTITAGLVGTAGLALKRFLPSYDVGINYVPQDMVAQIHEGEAIIPKKFNNAEFFSDMGGEDSEETNSLLRELISVVRNKDYTISTTDIGKSAVKYINTKSRELGGSLI